MKIILRLVFFVLLTIFSFIIYISFIGIETTRFNNQIQSKIQNINKNLNIELKEVKIIFNPLKFNLSAKTIGPKIFYQRNFLEIENIKTSVSIRSLFKDEFSIEMLDISTKSIEIKDLISFTRSFYRKPELILLEKLIKIKGYVIADISLKFDNEGNLKDNFIIKGFVRDTKFNLSKDYDIEKLDFIFNLEKNHFTFRDLKLKINGFNLKSEKIITSKYQNKFLFEGDFENKALVLDEKDIDNLKSIFNFNFDLKKIDFSSKNKFSFYLNKNLQTDKIKLSSKINIEEASFLNNTNLKKIFPEIKDEIILKNNEINFDYQENFFLIKGSGNISIQKSKDFISYKLEKKKDLLFFDNSLKIKDGPFLLDFLNFKKDLGKETIIEIVGNKKKDNQLLLNSITIKEDNNNIRIKNLVIDKNKIVNDFDSINLDYLDKDNQKNLIKIFKRDNYHILNGEYFNADNLIENILDNDKKSNFLIKNLRIKLNINQVRLDKEFKLNDLTGELIFKDQKLFNANLKGNFSDNKKMNFVAKSNENNKITTFTIDHAKPIVKRYKFIKGFEGGLLDLYNLKNDNISKSTLKIYDFKLKELPTLTKILTLASLQGIADILKGEGIRFNEFEMNFENKDNIMTINEIYAIGPAISILMDGYVEKNKLISLRGTLVPATTINKAIGSIPVLGKILVGSKTGEGVFGVSFKIKGPPKNLDTSVNPIKTLTPRFITRTLEKIKNF